MKTKTYSGLIALHSYGEAGDILFISSEKEPLAEELYYDISKRKVTVRYWITDREATKDEAQESFIKQLSGIGETVFGSHYSEITGYLWTDEEIKIGGHDLLEELKSFVGKWLTLEIDIYE